MDASIGAENQQLLWAEECDSSEAPEYLSQQLLTYLGNKRSLLEPIDQAVQKVKRRLGKERLRCLDAFSGSGVVSRLLKRHASQLYSVDLESYAAAVARCYLTNRGEADFSLLEEVVEDLNERVAAERMPPGFFAELYSPADEQKITGDDRVFYTRDNARRLDDYRRLLEDLPPATRELLLGPLLSSASVHANTAGVFKGFYKDSKTGVGRFGGSGADALSRIRATILLRAPVLSRFDCDSEVYQGDINELAPGFADLDLAYLDPPYNQHPYGSNYFMLNLLTEYRRPEEVSRVSGIPVDWSRSDYNVRAKSPETFRRLVESLDARFMLVSFSDEGFLSLDQMLDIFGAGGRVETVEIPYTVFRGCRNLRERSPSVTERLFLVERG